MDIHQLALSYDPEQDRLQLRVLTTDDTELRFGFTRRLVARWCKPLQEVIVELDARQAQAHTLKTNDKQILAELRHQQMIEHGRFGNQAPAAAKHQPFGETPMLVSGLKMAIQGQSTLRLSLHESQKEGARLCHLGLNSELAHALQHLLDQAVHKAEWNIPEFSSRGQTSTPAQPLPAQEAEASTAETTHSKPPYMH